MISETTKFSTLESSVLTIVHLDPFDEQERSLESAENSSTSWLNTRTPVTMTFSTSLGSIRTEISPIFISRLATWNLKAKSLNVSICARAERFRRHSYSTPSFSSPALGIKSRKRPSSDSPAVPFTFGEKANTLSKEVSAFISCLNVSDGSIRILESVSIISEEYAEIHCCASVDFMGSSVQLPSMATSIGRRKLRSLIFIVL